MWWTYSQALTNYRLCAIDAQAGVDAAAARTFAITREFTTLCSTYPAFGRASPMAAALSLPAALFYRRAEGVQWDTIPAAQWVRAA
jgi:hypothetical protein